MDVNGVDWPSVYRAHAPRLRRYVARTVGAELADDVVQETFLRAYRCASSLEPGRPIGPWLAVIARRAAIDTLRREQTYERANQETTPEPVIRHVEEELFNTIRRAGIAHSLQGINERHRRLLLNAELGAGGEEGSTSSDARKSVLARARRSFRSRYLEIVETTGVFGAALGRPVAARARTWLARAQLNLVDLERASLAACAGIVMAALGPSGTGVVGGVPPVAPMAGAAMPSASSSVPTVGPPRQDPTPPPIGVVVVAKAVVPASDDIDDTPAYVRQYHTRVAVQGPDGNEAAAVGTSDREADELLCMGGWPWSAPWCIDHPMRDGTVPQGG